MSGCAADAPEVSNASFNEVWQSMRCIGRISHQALTTMLMTLSCPCSIIHAANTTMLRNKYEKGW